MRFKHFETIILIFKRQKSSGKDMFTTTEFLLHPFIGRENPLDELFLKILKMFQILNGTFLEVKSLRKYHFINSIFLF